MKFINIFKGKKYTDKKIKKWAKDMFSGLEHDYKIYQTQCRERPGIDNIGEYIEALAVGNYIKWFIHNHFE